MPYRYTFFDNVPLPAHNPVDDLSTGDVPSTLIETMNGAVDAWGEQLRKTPAIQQIVFKGDYIAQNAIITDGQGNPILVPSESDKTKWVPLLAGTQFWTYLRHRTALRGGCIASRKTNAGRPKRMGRRPIWMMLADSGSFAACSG